MTNDRHWRVTFGYMGSYHGYEGPSTFLAGLSLAMLAKKGKCPDVWDINSFDADWSEDGGYSGADTRTIHEDEFFRDCINLGIRKRGNR